MINKKMITMLKQTKQRQTVLILLNGSFSPVMFCLTVNITCVIHIIVSAYQGKYLIYPMRIPVTKHGQTELIVTALICLIAGVWLFHLHPALILIPSLLFLSVVYFFRDPSRVIPSDEHIVLAPADGRIIELTEIKEHPYFEMPALKIGIFLSLLDVHINRAPCTGRVTSAEYKKGKFLIASHQAATELNESNTLMIESAHPPGLKIILRQIAGIIARRIVCECQVNDLIYQGAKIGMIKFGSRTEIYLPKTRVTEVRVKLGNKVKAGETILCHVKD